MKLYKFDYDGYGEYFFVMASSRKQAFEKVQEHVATDKYASCKNLWAIATVDHLPKKYSIREFNVGEVVEAEYA